MAEPPTSARLAGSLPGRLLRIPPTPLLVRIGAALLLPWILLEVGLRLAGYHAPDMRARLALFPKFPAFYEPDRDLAWVLKPNLDWRGLELAAPFTTDAQGHRITASPPDTHTPPLVDCLGDSSTFGFGVGDLEAFPALLAARLRDRDGRVRNLGVPGYSVFQAEMLADRQESRAPVTLVMVGFNDHFPALRSQLVDWRRRRVAYACFMSRVCSLGFDYLTAPDPTAPARSSVAPDYLPAVSPAEYREQLGETVRSLRRGGSEPILMVYPPLVVDDSVKEAVVAHWHQPRDQVDANVAAHPRYQQLTRDVAAEEGVALVDLDAAFAATGNAALHLDWVHPNGAGHGLIAQSVEPAVRAALARDGARATSRP